MMGIHPTAIVSNKVKIDKTVSIGPYSVIGEGVKIGEGTRIGAHCVIEGRTTIGKRNQIFSAAVIGSIPQDLKYKGEVSFLEIGDENIIREYITINPGTEANSKTVIGNNNLIMAYSHIADDCIIGNECIIANAGTLAGHVAIEDGAVIGGLVAIHQFCRVGKLSIIGGCSKVVQDIPPFSTCDGHPTQVYSLNLVGLRRIQMPKDRISSLKKAFKILFFSGLNISHAIENLNNQSPTSQEVQYLINFIKRSQRGLCRGARSCKERQLA